jgi:hypothetical protein
MEAMESSIRLVDTRWNIARTLVFGLLFLTSITIVTGFPQSLMLPAVLASGLGMLLGVWCLLKPTQTLVRCTLIVEAALFLLSLLVQLVSGSFLGALPLFLLAYVMILFSFETLDLVWKHCSVHSALMYALPNPRAGMTIKKSTDYIFRKLTRLSLLFGSSFVFALGAVFLGGFLAPISPVLTDISAYVVAVSISLVLLLILREDEQRLSAE